VQRVVASNFYLPIASRGIRYSGRCLTVLLTRTYTTAWSVMVARRPGSQNTSVLLKCTTAPSFVQLQKFWWLFACSNRVSYNVEPE